MSKFNVELFAALENVVIKTIQAKAGHRTVPLFVNEGAAKSNPRIISKAFHSARVMKAENDDLRDLQRIASNVYTGMQLYKMTNMDEVISDADAFAWMCEHSIGQEYLAAMGDFLKSAGKPSEFVRKALDTAESGGGLDFVPTNYSGELIEDYREDVFIFNVPHRRITMTSGVFELPMIGTAVKTRLEGESTGDDTHTETNFFTAVDPNTLSPALTAKKLAARTVWSNEINEDSVIAWIPFVEEEVGQMAARGLEQAVVSGDTNATHQDYDVHSASGNATDSRRAFLGYRGASFDQTSNIARIDGGNTRPTDRKISDVLVAMGKYGRKTKDVFLLGAPKMAQWLKRLPEDRFETRGEQDYYDGYPVHYSDEMPTNLHDTGVNTNGGDNDTTSLLAVTASRWIFGDRRALTMKIVDREETDQKVMVVSERVGFRQLDATASVPTVGNLYNLK